MRYEEVWDVPSIIAVVTTRERYYATVREAMALDQTAWWNQEPNTKLSDAGDH
jgi:hypothetical protein